MSQRIKRRVAVIGSGARETPEHLRDALDVCLRMGIVPVMVEHPAGGDDAAVEAALGLLDEADVYVGIIGDSYGPAVPGHDRSLTEMEYERASSRGIPRLMFATGAGRAETADASNTEAADARLEAFARRVGERELVRHAGSLKEFRELLSEGLIELGMRARTRAELKPAEAETTPALKKGGGDANAKSLGRVQGENPHTARKMGGGDGQAKVAKSKTTPGVKFKRTFRVFVASPGDVHEERSSMPKVVESLNKTLGNLLNVGVELWRWEADAPPAVGEPQALIDPEIDAADVVLVIFWNRFGTPTASGTTGTESEVLRSLRRWGEVRRPQVMVYFCQRPALLNRDGLDQRLKLLDFRERIAPLVLAVDYGEVQEFEWRVRDDLFINIARLCVRRK